MIKDTEGMEVHLTIDPDCLLVYEERDSHEEQGSIYLCPVGTSGISFQPKRGHSEESCT